MKKVLLVLLVVAGAFSCRRPPSCEQFLFKEVAEYGDSYPFKLDLSDTAAVYDLSLVIVLERKAFSRFSADSLLLTARWISPSDSVFADTARIALGPGHNASYFTKEHTVSFRKGFLPVESGEWRLVMRIRNPVEHLRGLGIICERKNRWDTEN